MFAIERWMLNVQLFRRAGCSLCTDHGVRLKVQKDLDALKNIIY